MLGWKRSEERFSLVGGRGVGREKDTLFPPVLIAEIFLSGLPICTLINDCFFSVARNGRWLGGERVRVMQSLR